MGKSRLLAEVASRGRSAGIAVGSGAAEPGGRVVELAALLSTLFDGPSPLLDRRELTGLPSQPEQRYWLLRELEALLERAALASPLLICVDDVQWADSGTAAALRTLPGQLAGLPIAWVIAVRPAGAVGGGGRRAGSAQTRRRRDRRTRSSGQPIRRPVGHRAARRSARERGCSSSSSRRAGSRSCSSRRCSAWGGGGACGSSTVAPSWSTDACPTASGKRCATASRATRKRHKMR